jgi:hypothetical protein
MQVTVAREYAHLFKDLGFTDEFDDESDSPVANLFAEEMNYALGVGTGDDGFGCRGLPRGIPYHGSHESGYEYSGGAFATLGQTMIRVDKLHGGQIAAAVTINDDGWSIIDLGTLSHIQRYVETLRAVEKIHAELIAKAESRK